MNGYCEVEINGKKVGFKFNRYCVEQVPFIKGNMSITNNVTAIIYCGMLGNCYAKQIEPVMTFEEMSDWIDEQAIKGEIEVIKMIFDCYNDSLIVKGSSENRQNGTADDDTKKKIMEPAPL